jgi:hypothetical protein
VTISRPTEISADGSGSLPKLFISYRREDADWPAIMLRDALAEHYGEDQVFMDIVDLLPGEDFVDKLQRSVRGCDVLLALIGPNWARILQERTRRRAMEGEEDHVRVELETALATSTVRVIPVLLGGASMPPSRMLPHSLERLLRLEAARFRPDQKELDLQSLIALMARPAAPLPPPPPPAPAPPPSGPLQRHYQEVLGYLRDGTIVPFLGSSVNATERAGDPWREGSGSLPDGEELAGYLAAEFGYAQQTADLARVSQFVRSIEGEFELYERLRRVFTVQHSPSALHRFLAELPGLLDGNGSDRRCQLIVTMNYDDALEQAFDAVHEAYDLAVYMANGKDRGKFVHHPWGEDPITVDTPNRYSGFPIDVESLAVQRTVIMKVHGAVSPVVGGDNYVITENDYIEYLSRTEIVSLVPSQLLNKMLKSHVLFLGQSVRDWNWRVFLQRVWEGRLGAKAWAIDPDLDELEESYWHELGVHKVLEEPLQTYADGFRAQLMQAASNPR